MSASRKRSPRKRRGRKTARTGNGLRLFAICLAVLCLVGLFFGLRWLDRLDTQVSAAFESDRWAIPGRIYARPLELYPGLQLDPAELVGELSGLGYRQTSSPREPGSFDLANGRAVVMTRAFDFPEGQRPAMELRIAFGQNTVASLTDARGNSINVVRLEPRILGSATPGEHEDRTLIRLGEVPPALIEALLVVEDRSFFEHAGVDPRGIARAAWANLRAKRVVQGGSTITQQLVKSFYLDARRTLKRKVTEAAMAVLLERRYSKQQILENYLNEVYLGQSGNRAIHGFGLASQFYFGRPLKELALSEIALLVGMVRGPSLYNPRSHPARSKARRDRVLDAVAGEAGLSSESLTSLKAEGLGVSASGSASAGHPAFSEFVKREMRGAYSPENVDVNGLSVFTTLDPRIQQLSERALAAGLSSIESARKMKAGELEGAIVVVRIDNGEVLSLVGGRKPGFAGFNRALDARRPVGSLIKPAIYLAALEQPARYTLATRLIDQRFSITDELGKVWAPDNYDKIEHGEVALIDALSRSHNLSTARLGLEVGVPVVKETAERLGLPEPGPPFPSMLLGAVEAAPIGVAQMYQSIANGGLRAPLRAVVGLVHSDGTPLPRSASGLEQVAQRGPTRLVVRGLQEVLITGTGKSVAGRFASTTRLAGKTGTTDDFRDSWFAGFSGNTLAVVWVGRDDNEPTGLTGASGALRIWADLMATLEPKPVIFGSNDSVEMAMIDPATGLLGDTNCAGVRELPFLAGSVPSHAAPCAGFQIVQPIRRVFGDGLRRWFDNLTGRSSETSTQGTVQQESRPVDTRSAPSVNLPPARQLPPVTERPVRPKRERWNIEDSNR